MKELWKANPFHLMNSPFAEMSYSSSGLNIVPERLLLATRQPSTHYPLASGAAFFDPLRTTCRRATNHLQHTANIWRPPPQAICRRSAQHLATPRTASAISLRAILWPLRHIRRLSACPSARQFTTRYPPAHRKPSAISLRVIRWHPAGICWHEPMPLTARRTNRRRKQEP